MSDKAYNRIANALLLVGVGSALLFDAGLCSKGLAVGLGVSAGVGAAVVYFRYGGGRRND